MNSQIPILSWSQVSSNCNDRTIPVAFFYPTIEFLTFLGLVGNENIPICIEGTMYYDGKQTVSFDQTTIPECCPSNFDSRKPIMACFLNFTPFQMYPTENGFINFRKFYPQIK
jgi:hypothetical protein